ERLAHGGAVAEQLHELLDDRGVGRRGRGTETQHGGNGWREQLPRSDRKQSHRSPPRLAPDSTRGHFRHCPRETTSLSSRQSSVCERLPLALACVGLFASSISSTE